MRTLMTIRRTKVAQLVLAVVAALGLMLSGAPSASAAPIFDGQIPTARMDLVVTKATMGYSDHYGRYFVVEVKNQGTMTYSASNPASLKSTYAGVSGSALINQPLAPGEAKSFTLYLNTSSPSCNSGDNIKIVHNLLFELTGNNTFYVC